MQTYIYEIVVGFVQSLMCISLNVLSFFWQNDIKIIDNQIMGAFFQHQFRDQDRGGIELWIERGLKIIQK